MVHRASGGTLSDRAILKESIYTSSLDLPFLLHSIASSSTLFTPGEGPRFVKSASSGIWSVVGVVVLTQAAFQVISLPAVIAASRLALKDVDVIFHRDVPR